MTKKYLTTPIFYANSEPHIGHLYTGLICDFWKRTNEVLEQDVFLSSGMDEHGQKVYQSAIAKGSTPQEYVDSISEIFTNFFKKYSVNYSYWVKTTNKDHQEAVKIFWNKLKDNGYIYKSNYEGWYSISDEAYLDIPKDYISTSPNIVWREEDCYYFKLSAFQEQLTEFYKNNKEAVYPKTRYNEVMGFLKQGLKDFAISRPKDRLSWGIEVPNDPENVMYVWIDALVNYLSLIGYPDKVKYTKYWPGTHVVGKDILKFHAIYWPALLMAAQIELPKQVIAHGWWLNGDQKISKSLNNAIDIAGLTESYGADTLRYFLLSNMSLGEDGDFKEELFSVCYTSLSNKYGNLLLRLLGMAKNNNFYNLDVCTLHPQIIDFLNDIKEKAESFSNDITLFDDYIDQFMLSLDFLNNYINEHEIWSFSGYELEKELYNLFYAYKIISILFSGLFPELSQKIADFFDTQLILSQGEIHKAIALKEAIVLFPKK